MLPFVTQCKEFFGMKPNETIGEFAKEIKELTDQDKMEIFEGFKKIGIECEPPRLSNQQ